MEPIHTSRASIKPIWKIIVGTMIFVSISGFSWHLGEIRDVHARERAEIKALRTEVTQLSDYRDVLVKEGTTTAKQFLEGKSQNTYGF